VLHAFVDESERNGLLVCVVVMSPSELTAARASLRAMLRPGQRRLHFVGSNHICGGPVKSPPGLVATSCKLRLRPGGRSSGRPTQFAQHSPETTRRPRGHSPGTSTLTRAGPPTVARQGDRVAAASARISSPDEVRMRRLKLKTLCSRSARSSDARRASRGEVATRLCQR
jgi:hypothetical protein